VPADDGARSPAGQVRLGVVAAHWGRLGCIGFGGPPAHIVLLRRLCVERHAWLTSGEFEDAIAATNLLPGPASTQLAIYCAWRLRGALGGVVGGVCFILPGLIIILGMSALLTTKPPAPLAGAAAGAGAAVAAVAVHAASQLVPASWGRAGGAWTARTRWLGYLLAGALAAAQVAPWLVLVLLGCGLLEVTVAEPGRPGRPGRPVLALLAAPAVTAASWAPLVWTATKAGALSYGGGFVIIPLMRADAVERHHWMSAAQFSDAVALGQITPGPVMQTVAAVGYAAGGLPGGLLAAAVAFAPSFAFVLAGGRLLHRLRGNRRVEAFLGGAGPAAIGAIAGAAVPLALAVRHPWQLAILVAAACYLLLLRGNVVLALLGAATVGALIAATGAATG
jgi:chromate transporter